MQECCHSARVVNVLIKRTSYGWFYCFFFPFFAAVFLPPNLITFRVFFYWTSRHRRSDFQLGLALLRVFLFSQCHSPVRTLNRAFMSITGISIRCSNRARVLLCLRTTRVPPFFLTALLMRKADFPVISPASNPSPRHPHRGPLLRVRSTIVLVQKWASANMTGEEARSATGLLARERRFEVSNCIFRRRFLCLK